VPKHCRKQLFKVQNRVEKDQKFLKGQLEESWESRKSTKWKELFSVLQMRHTSIQNMLRDMKRKIVKLKLYIILNDQIVTQLRRFLILNV
jgi:hypothetical protein